MNPQISQLERDIAAMNQRIGEIQGEIDGLPRTKRTVRTGVLAYDEAMSRRLGELQAEDEHLGLQVRLAEDKLSRLYAADHQEKRSVTDVWRVLLEALRPLGRRKE